MEISNDLRTQRDRQWDAALDADLDLGAAEALGSAARFGETTMVAIYPTVASAYYAIRPADISGAETEGGAATYTLLTGTPFYALNLGTQVPPQGTPIICHAVGKRWCFRYDG